MITDKPDQHRAKYSNARKHLQYQMMTQL